MGKVLLQVDGIMSGGESSTIVTDFTKRFYYLLQFTRLNKYNL